VPVVDGLAFEEADYDEDMDVLYLRNGGRDAQRAATTHASPEGHAVSVLEDGSVVGVTIINARWLIEQDGQIAITVPSRTMTIDPQEVGTVLEGIAQR
jgi:uncharacterized protein YuzE